MTFEDNHQNDLEGNIDKYWTKYLEGDNNAFGLLKDFYTKNLLRIKPLYENIEEATFNEYLDKSVSKALERGLKFQIEDHQHYMTIASQTYFKFFLLPESDNIHIPAELFNAYSKLEELYNKVPQLEDKAELEQVELLSKGFEYPIFSTRLLFYSYRKWKNNLLRQVDIDLTVSLLPGPKRIEWEVFYEKDLDDIAKTIIKEIV